MIEKDSLEVEREISDLNKFLSKRVRGQPKAIETICNLIEDDINLGEIEEKEGPVGLVLFLGPSGVGKTELARAMAEFSLGSRHNLTKIQCVTLTQPHTIQSLLGAPPSYVGYQDPPLLAEERIFKKTTPGVSHTSPEVILFRQRKNALSSNIIDTRRERAAIGYEWNAKLGNLELIKKTLDIVAEIEELKSKINLSGQKKYSHLNLDYEEIMRVIATTEADIQFSLSKYEECNAKLNILMTELKKITDRLRNLEGSINTPDEKGPSTKVVPLLWDEIEQAHEAIHNLLLQIGEEGRVTLANGKTSDLRKTLMILTSNIGAKAMGEILREKFFGFTGPKLKSTITIDYPEQALEELEKKILKIAETGLKDKFSPAFISRIDAIVVFRPLSRATFRQILDDQIDIFSEALAKKRQIKFMVDEPVKEKVLDSSLHRPEVGARLLNHKLKSIVKRPFGRKLARYTSYKGAVRAYLDKDRVNFEFS